jgi:hypothetical protein
MPLDRKPTTEQSRARRWEVFRLAMMEHRSHSEIAVHLGTSRRTISNDVAWLRNHLRELTLDFDGATEVACTAEALNALGGQALQDARNATSYRDRAALYRVGADTWMRRIELLKGCGVVETMPQTIDVGLSSLDFNGLSTDALLQHREKLMHRIKEILFGSSGDSQSAPRTLPPPADPSPVLVPVRIDKAEIG